MKEQFQSLTVALDRVSETPAAVTAANRNRSRKTKDSQRAEISGTKAKRREYTLPGRESSKKEWNVSLKKIGPKNKLDQERSYELKRRELKKYLAHLTSKHTADILLPQSDKKQSTPEKSKKKNAFHPTHRILKRESEPANQPKNSMRKVQIHSLPHISDHAVRCLRPSNVSRQDTDILPSRLTAYGLASLQERVYKIDTSYRHAPYIYHSSSYGHPYVSDDLFERITTWIRTVNISVDWANVVQSVSDDIVSYTEEEEVEP